MATGMLQLWEPQQLSQMKAGVRKKPPSPTRAPWAGQGAHRGSPACSKHRQVPRCHSCALVPGRAGGQPAPLALPWLCLSVTQQPAEERRGTGARCWLCFHSLDPGAPLTRGWGQGSSWHCPRGTQSKEGQEGQADACTILALGWGLCGSTTASCSCFPSWEGHEHMETCMDTHGNAWKRMDTHGNTWTYMETYGHTWTHMEIHGNTWKCMDTNGNALKHMDIHGNAWIHIETHGHTWKLMDIHGNAWKCMDTHGHTWKCIKNHMETHGHTWIHMEMHGHTWKHMETHGHTWKCMDTYGNTWKHMDTHGNAWKHMDTHGNTWTHMEMHGNSWTHMETYGNTWKHMETHGKACSHMFTHPVPQAFPVTQDQLPQEQPAQAELSQAGSATIPCPQHQGLGFGRHHRTGTATPGSSSALGKAEHSQLAAQELFACREAKTSQFPSASSWQGCAAPPGRCWQSQAAPCPPHTHLGVPKAPGSTSGRGTMLKAVSEREKGH